MVLTRSHHLGKVEARF